MWRSKNSALPLMVCPLIKGRAGVALYGLDGTDIFVSFKLECLCFNNEAKYETLIIGLISALRMGIRKVQVQEGSKFIIKQVNEELP